jgi:hypothetical protein
MMCAGRVLAEDELKTLQDTGQTGGERNAHGSGSQESVWKKGQAGNCRFRLLRLLAAKCAQRYRSSKWLSYLERATAHAAL